MAVVPIQAATMGWAPGGPYCVAVHGLLKCGGTKGGRVRKVKLKRAEIEVEFPKEITPVDVTRLEVLVSAMRKDIGELTGQIINEKQLREQEEEILLLMEMFNDFI